MGWSLLSPETTSAVRDKKLYEWILLIVLSNSVAKEFLTWFPAISEMLRSDSLTAMTANRIPCIESIVAILIANGGRRLRISTQVTQDSEYLR